jgi:hypothetical protein
MVQSSEITVPENIRVVRPVSIYTSETPPESLPVTGITNNTPTIIFILSLAISLTILSSIVFKKYKVRGYHGTK